MFDDDDEEENEFPLQFHETLGEHTLSDDIRNAIMWAAIQKFLVDSDNLDLIDQDAFSDKDRTLAKAVMFHGPFNDFEEAVKLAQHKQGVVVAPEATWTEDSQPVWIACLSN